MFAIIHKDTNEFFAGFNGNKAVFTNDKNKAWKDIARIAKLQAGCFISNGINVQRKPVAL